MSWKEICGLAKRERLVKLALRAQQSMSQLCRLFRVSRKTGYKWKGRFERDGRAGLRDRSRRPHRSPRQLSVKWLKRIRQLRRRHRSWGGRKLSARLREHYRGQKIPSARAIDTWLKRWKLTRRRTTRRPRGPLVKRRALTAAKANNQVWTVDFKGWFRTQDGRRVEPLTVRDLFSRYVLSIRLLQDQRWEPVQRVFRRLFGQYGYPKVIRVDNGGPFGSNGPAGLSRLSAWWTALGMGVEFIAPGHPEQNAGHEQMHRVLKAETTVPASQNSQAQQRRTNRWRGIYNQIRPHAGLGLRPPAEIYRRGRREQRSLKLSYPVGWAVRKVRSNGEIRWQGRKRFVGEAFVGYPVGLRGRGRTKQSVYFGNLLIGELRQADRGGMRPAKYWHPF